MPTALDYEQQRSVIVERCIEREQQSSDESFDDKWWLLCGVGIGAAIAVITVVIVNAVSSDCGSDRRYPCSREGGYAP